MDLECLLPLRYGPSTGSLVGSSLEPAAGFKGYRFCRRPLRLESPRIRCLDFHVALNGYLLAWMGISLGSILEPLGSFGLLLGRLWVACGLHWVRRVLK